MKFCEGKCNKCYFIIISLIFVFYFIFTIYVSNYNYSHINSFNRAPERVASNEYILFDTNRIVEKNDILHEEGSYDFIINKSGNYYIQFNTTIYEPPSTGKETTLSVYLEHNNATVYGSTVGEKVSNAYQTINLNFAVIIEANKGDILRIKNSSATVVELLQPNVDIIRIK